MTKDKRSNAEKPAGQESGAEFKDDPKSGPSAGRRGGESRSETNPVRPAESAERSPDGTNGNRA